MSLAGCLQSKQQDTCCLRADPLCSNTLLYCSALCDIPTSRLSLNVQGRMGSSKAGKRKASALNGETDNLPVSSRRGPGRPKVARVSADCFLIWQNQYCCSDSVWVLCLTGKLAMWLAPGTHRCLPLLQTSPGAE